MARTDTLGNFLTDVADAIREKKGTTDTILASNFDTEIASIEGGTTEPTFTGSYDKQGLKQIGWSDEEIEYYQQNGVQWNASENEYFKLTQTELAGDTSTNTRFLPKNNGLLNFRDYHRLLAIANLDNIKTSTLTSLFIRCYSLTTIPNFDTSNITDMSYTFFACRSLESIPQLNTSKVKNMSQTFRYCNSLVMIPLLDTSSVTDMSLMFDSCSSLKTIPLLDTSKVYNFSETFSNCFSLKSLPLLDTSSATKMSYSFNNCYSLMTIPQLNTSNVTDIHYMFCECTNLTTIPQLNGEKLININYAFRSCSSLRNFDGLINLGQAYLTTTSANYNDYKLDLSNSTSLTEQSIINILNNLYDIATKGCNTQTVTLGATNLAKLTSTEGQQALASAQSKGWSIS